MSNDDMISEIERTLDKAGVGTQRPRLHNLGSIFPSQAERVEMLVEQRDDLLEALEELRAATDKLVDAVRSGEMLVGDMHRALEAQDKADAALARARGER